MKKTKEILLSAKSEITFSLGFPFLSLFLPSLRTMGRGLSQRRRVANVLKARQVRIIQ